MILNVSSIKVLNEILDWSNKYLSRNSPYIQRPKGSQLVCPFVKNVIKNGSFYIKIITEKSIKNIEQIALDGISEFRKLDPVENDTYKKSLIIVFENIKDIQTETLETVQRKLKSTFVSNQLMLGNFHPDCIETGPYNKDFKSNIAPYPLFVIRNMALHDILYLQGNKNWFESYDKVYGEFFCEDGRINDHNSYLKEYYEIQRKMFHNEKI